MSLTFELTQDGQTPADYVCESVACDEARRAQDVSAAMRLAGVTCPVCGCQMHPAPYARAVPRVPSA